jgi:hypothetical protein
MLSELTTLTAENAFVFFLFALLFTGHVCLFFDISKFQKYPLSHLNYVNAGILSALVTTVSFYTIRLSSTTANFILVTVIGFISATAITLSLQKLSDLMFNRENVSS